MDNSKNATTDQSESSIPEGCVKAFLKCLITMFAVFPVPRNEQYHGYTHQRLSRKGCVLPDPKCWAAHRIHCHFAYYPVCWRHQSGVERKKRMKVRNKEQLFSVPETQNWDRHSWFFCLYVRLVLYLLLGKHNTIIWSWSTWFVLYCLMRFCCTDVSVSVWREQETVQRCVRRYSSVAGAALHWVSEQLCHPNVNAEASFEWDRIMFTQSLTKGNESEDSFCVSFILLVLLGKGAFQPFMSFHWFRTRSGIQNVFHQIN